MSSISKQISAAAQTTLTSPLAVINSLSKTVFGSLEKIMALNISTAKQSLENSSAATRQLFALSKPEELLTLSKAQSYPQIEKMTAYARELADISAHARSEFLKAFTPAVETSASAVTLQITTPAAAKPVATTVSKPEKKPALVFESTSNTQLPLLAEAEVKVEKPVAKMAAKTANKPAILPAAQAVKPAAKTKAVVKPVPVTSKVSVVTAAPAVVKSVETIVAQPVNKLDAKPEIKVAETAAETVAVAATVAETKTKTKLVAAATDVKASTPTAVVAKPAAELVVAKKSAVKLPFPASPVKQAAKPSFPAVGGRPAYKAKGSAATGAKKPVRQ